MDVSLQHYEILEGYSLLKFIVIECVLLLTVLSMSMDIVMDLQRIKQRSKSGQIAVAWQMSPPTKFGQIGKVLADTVTVVLVIVSGALRTWLKINSSYQTEQIVGGLASIPWDSSDVLMTEKKRSVIAFISALSIFFLYALGSDTVFPRTQDQLSFV